MVWELSGSKNIFKDDNDIAASALLASVSHSLFYMLPAALMSMCTLLFSFPYVFAFPSSAESFSSYTTCFKSLFSFATTYPGPTLLLHVLTPRCPYFQIIAALSQYFQNPGLFYSHALIQFKAPAPAPIQWVYYLRQCQVYEDHTQPLQNNPSNWHQPLLCMYLLCFGEPVVYTPLDGTFATQFTFRASSFSLPKLPPKSALFGRNITLFGLNTCHTRSYSTVRASGI